MNSRRPPKTFVFFFRYSKADQAALTLKYRHRHLRFQATFRFSELSSRFFSMMNICQHESAVSGSWTTGLTSQVSIIVEPAAAGAFQCFYDQGAVPVRFPAQ